MSALRLVMVTPRYWPQVGETEQFLANLAEGLAGPRTTASIVTARWGCNWPREVVHREIRVLRLPHAPLGGWTTFRHMLALGRWLRVHSDAFDVVYVTSLRQEAYTALRAVRRGRVAVVLRAQVGDAAWLKRAKFGGRVQRQLVQADAVVAPTRSLALELEQLGITAKRIARIANGVPTAAARSDAARFQARAALAQAQSDLAVADYGPVAVSVGRLTQQRRLLELVDAWRLVASRWPTARLWLLGDGPLREAIYQRVVDRGLHRQVLLPGTFDDLAEIYQAADLYVADAPAVDGGQFVLEAMAAGLPIVAADSPDHRELLQHEMQGLLVPMGAREELAKAIARLLDAPQTACRWGQAARQTAERGFSLAGTVARHRQLFERLAARRDEDRR